MQEILAENSTASTPSNYLQFCYPTAWGCALYEPTGLKGALSDTYKIGQWYLPACGEQTRICNFLRQGATAASANFAPDSEAKTPIFANAASKSGLTIITTQDRWDTSTESYTSTRVILYGTTSITIYDNKSFTYPSRPCCQVTFNLNE